jgi:histidyl-tRNA synthetase
LVRGLDYYTKTVFEVFSSYNDPKKEGEAKQLALAGGGRYDKLVKLLGGKDIPACGGAGGVDRIVMMMKNQEVKLPEPLPPQIFLAQLGILAKKKSLKILNELWHANIRVAESFGRDSLQAQLARANKLGAKLTLILGQKEALEGSIIIRDMDDGKQKIVKLEKAVQEVKEMLKK